MKLTQLEHKIAALIAIKVSEREIAKKYQLHKSTVHFYVKNIALKLSANDGSCPSVDDIQLEVQHD